MINTLPLFRYRTKSQMKSELNKHGYNIIGWVDKQSDICAFVIFIKPQDSLSTLNYNGNFYSLIDYRYFTLYANTINRRFKNCITKYINDIDARINEYSIAHSSKPFGPSHFSAKTQKSYSNDDIIPWIYYVNTFWYKENTMPVLMEFAQNRNPSFWTFYGIKNRSKGCMEKWCTNNGYISIGWVDANNCSFFIFKSISITHLVARTDRWISYEYVKDVSNEHIKEFNNFIATHFKDLNQKIKDYAATHTTNASASGRLPLATPQRLLLNEVTYDRIFLVFLSYRTGGSTPDFIWLFRPAKTNYYTFLSHPNTTKTKMQEIHGDAQKWLPDIFLPSRQGNGFPDFHCTVGLYLISEKTRTLLTSFEYGTFLNTVLGPDDHSLAVSCRQLFRNYVLPAISPNPHIETKLELWVPQKQPSDTLLLSGHA